MWQQEAFREGEKTSAIMQLDRGFLYGKSEEEVKAIGEAWYESIHSHVERAGGIEKLYPKAVEAFKEAPRIIAADAVRTYNTEAHQEVFSRVLKQMVEKIWWQQEDVAGPPKDDNEAMKYYQQGLGYTCGFLLIFMPEEQCVEVLLGLASIPHYIPHYWEHQLIASATDSYVMWEMMDENLASYPHLGSTKQILSEMCMMPETFSGKWFTGLCIHVLPYEHLVTFFNNFMKEGKLYLLSFALALLDGLHISLEKNKGNHGVVFGLLRLEASSFEEDTYDGFLVEALAAAEGGLDEVKSVLTPEVLKARQEQVYEKYLRRRIERANEVIEYSDSITDFSTEEAEEED